MTKKKIAKKITTPPPPPAAQSSVGRKKFLKVQFEKSFYIFAPDLLYVLFYTVNL